MSRPRSTYRVTLFACALSPIGAAWAGDLAVEVRNAQGAPLPEAVVYATSQSAPAPAAQPASADIDQVDKEFVPLVTVVRKGTGIHFPNHDNIRHQVYSFSPAKTFTTKLYSGRESEPVVFDQTGVVVLGCNIHDQMHAWVVVVDTPWFGKTAADGNFALAHLPAGKYRLNVWYPGLDAADMRDIEIPAAGTVQQRVTIDRPVAH